MRKFFSLFFLLIFITLGCSRSEDKEPEKELTASDNITEKKDVSINKNLVARVNGVPIYREDLNQKSLDEVIDRELLYQEAIRNGFGKEEELQQKDENSKKKLILKSFIDDQKKSIEVSESEIEAYYKENKGDYEIIVVTELVFTNKHLAEEAHTRINAGEDFDKLRSEYLKDHHKAHMHTKSDPKYKDVFIERDVGSTSDVIGEHGEYKVSKLIERNEIPLERLREFIEGKIRIEKRDIIITAMVEKLRKESKVEKISQKQVSGTAMRLSKDSFVELAKDCLEMPHSIVKTNCLMPYFQVYTRNRSAKDAIALAHQLQEEGKIDDCHMIAHHIGKAVIQKNDYDVKKSFSSCTRQCLQGCYHAVIENYIGHVKWNPDEIVSITPTLCDEISSSRVLKGQCIHGVGHGLISNDFLPLNVAIDVCQKLPNSTQTDYCLGGVFMEHANELLYYDEKDLIDFIPTVCKQVDELGNMKLSQQCAKAIGEGLMFYSGHDLKKSAELCKTLDAVVQKECIIAAEEMKNWHMDH